jgi:hypothetical protein
MGRPLGLFGLTYESVRLGVMGMCNVLLLGLFLLADRHPLGRPFLIAFEVSGTLILLAFIHFARRHPEHALIVSMVLSLPTLPFVYLIKLLPQDVANVCGTALILTFPQFLLASVFGMAARIVRRRLWEPAPSALCASDER